MESLNDNIESMQSIFAYNFTPNANPEEFLTNFVPEYNVFDTTYRDNNLNDISSGNHRLKEEGETSKEDVILSYDPLEITDPFYGVQLTEEEVNTLFHSFTDFPEPQELLNYELSLYENVIVEPTKALPDSHEEHSDNYVLVLAANPMAEDLENHFLDPNLLRLKHFKSLISSQDYQSIRITLSDGHVGSLNAASGQQVLAISNQSASSREQLVDIPLLASSHSEGLSWGTHSPAENLHCGRFSVNTIPNIEISLEESLVQCLAVVINYHGYTGTILSTEYEASGKLVNHACTLHDCRSVASKAITQIPMKNNEISGSLQRVRYIRDIHEIYNSVTGIVYYESSVFNSTNPYEPQYFRYEIDEKGARINESKCGACPYCEELKFLTFKNSSYLSHLTLEHGIYSNNYLIPEGLYYGVYEIKKAEPETPSLECLEKPRPRHTKAVQCPVCFEVVEVCCWSMKTNPLLSYFRHFKKRHSNLPNTPATAQSLFNTNTHVHIKKRGRTLHVKDK